MMRQHYFAVTHIDAVYFFRFSKKHEKNNLHQICL